MEKLSGIFKIVTMTSPTTCFDLEYSETLFIRSNGLNQMSNRLDILLSAISYIDVLQVHLSVITDKQFVVMTKI